MLMGKPKILIIDDDGELCAELSEFLTDEGYAVTCEGDPVKGDGLIRSGTYEAVLLDHKMSALSGLDILRKLKADNIRKRIFILSGRPLIHRVLEEEGLMDMVSGIIQKPGDLSGIVDKIKIR